ncbi:hypothetical protein Areg01_80320 [Actinoplanes regularis]|nr:hypothetical protein Areg01_80320 [Actinoplanes regularis]
MTGKRRIRIRRWPSCGRPVRFIGRRDSVRDGHSPGRGPPGADRSVAVQAATGRPAANERTLSDRIEPAASKIPVDGFLGLRGEAETPDLIRSESGPQKN